jgi:hypothetical protein
MAKETITRLKDDLDGSEAKSTIAFTWAGTAYEIDLSAKNSRAFDEAIAPFVAASRRVGKPATKTAARKAASRPVRATVKHDLAAVRAWAISTGQTVATRGRIAASLIEAYHAAQNATGPSVSTVSEPAPTAVTPVANAAAKKTVSARKAAPRKATRERSAKPAARSTTARKAAAKKIAATKAPAAAAASE